MEGGGEFSFSGQCQELQGANGLMLPRLDMAPSDGTRQMTCCIVCPYVAVMFYMTMLYDHVGRRRVRHIGSNQHLPGEWPRGTMTAPAGQGTAGLGRGRQPTKKSPPPSEQVADGFVFAFALFDQPLRCIEGH